MTARGEPFARFGARGANSEFEKVAPDPSASRWYGGAFDLTPIVGAAGLDQGHHAILSKNAADIARSARHVVHIDVVLHLGGLLRSRRRRGCSRRRLALAQH